MSIRLPAPGPCRFRPFVLICCVLVALASGCASEIGAKRFSELLNRYSATWDPLAIQQLSATTPLPPSVVGKPLMIIVHPGYSLFFREERRSTYSEAKYGLLEHQLSQEARFITRNPKADNVLILVLPGSYEKDSIAPRSYTAYLNSIAGGKTNVYYIFSETSTSGALPLDTTLTLFSFLQNIRASRILIGGGYIGRCQKEFYEQLATYIEKAYLYIVPEISSVSPDDVSSAKAAAILEALRHKDYRRIVEFIVDKTNGTANIMPLSGEAPPAD